MSVKKSGMGLQNLETSAAEKYTSSLHAIYDLIDTVTGERDFTTNDQLHAVKD